MLTGSIILSFLLLLSTVLSISNHPHWTVRLFDFPRLQLLTLSSITVSYFAIKIIQAPHLLHLSGIGALLTLIYQANWVYPYTCLAEKEVKDIKEVSCDATTSHKAEIKLLAANVLQSNRQYHKLIKLVKETQPDLLITLESDVHWENALSELKIEMPHSISVPQDNLYGMHLFSKYPLSQTNINRRVKNDIPSITTFVQIPGEVQAIRLEVLHPMPPSPTESELSLSRDKELIQVAKELQKETAPVIVAGDLNDVAWSRSTSLFKKISHLLDPRAGRGWFSTFHASLPCLRWPLDHVFVSKHFSVKDLRSMEAIGSDHFPIYAHLQLNHSYDLSNKKNPHDAITPREQSLKEDRANNC